MPAHHQFSTLAEAWAGFREQVLPDAGPERAFAAKTAFYAGALAFHNVLMSFVDDDDADAPPTPGEEASFARLRADLVAFSTELQERR